MPKKAISCSKNLPKRQKDNFLGQEIVKKAIYCPNKLSLFFLVTRNYIFCYFLVQEIAFLPFWQFLAPRNCLVYNFLRQEMALLAIRFAKFFLHKGGQ